MNTTKLSTIAAVAATLSVAMSAVASAAPTKSGSSPRAPTSSVQAAKVKTAGLWGSIDTGNLELDKFCEGEADFINQPAMQTPKGGNSMGDLKELNTGIANQANQKGCKLFPQ